MHTNPIHIYMVYCTSSFMMNINLRPAVRMQHLPENADWNDTTPQRRLDSLTINDFMLSESEAEEFKQRAILYTARYLVKEFKSLGDLQKFLPTQSQIHPVVKTEFVPMKVLFKDEKYTSETIDILCSLMKDADLKGNNQVHISHSTRVKLSLLLA